MKKFIPGTDLNYCKINRTFKTAVLQSHTLRRSKLLRNDYKERDVSTAVTIGILTITTTAVLLLGFI